MKKAAKLGADGGVLPTDVLYEVLLRLPAKEVCRLRLVCRRWRSLTSDPVFARDHGSRHRRHLVGLHGDLDEVHVLDLSGNIQKRIRLEHGFSTSWNAQLDLICVRVDWGKACVLNLATGAVVADISLPEQNNNPLPRFVLGHVPTTGVYKVLCLNYRIKSHHQVTYRRQACSVLTLDDSSRWRARPDAPAPTVPSSRYIALIRGVAYFVVMNSEPDISIASFDFAAEEWTRIIQGPVVSCQKDGFYTMFLLAALSDCLVAVHNNHRGMSVDLWFMDDMEHSLWTKRYSVDREQPPRFATFCPLAVVSDDEDGDLLLGAKCKGSTSL